MARAKLVCGVLAALLLCANARLVIVQGEHEEPLSVETKTYYVLQPSSQGEEVEQVESWSSPEDRTWGSLQTIVLNPFTWFMQQLQELDTQLASSFATRDEMVRKVGRSRFRQAMKEYQSANRLVSQIVEGAQSTEEEEYEEYYSDEYYMLEDQEALKLMALMDDKYMSVYSDEEEVAREEADGGDHYAAAADGNSDDVYAEEADSVMSTEDAQEMHDRAQLVAELNAAEARAGMAAEAARGQSTFEVLVGRMAGDGHLRTARYTVGRDGVLNPEGHDAFADAGQQLEAEQQPQPVEEVESDDNLDEAVSVADLMMEQVRAAYLRGQREAARARADAAMLAAATQAIEGGATAAAAATYDEDGDDVFAFGGSRAHSAPRSTVLDPLAALGNLLDALLLGGAPMQRASPLAVAAAERAGVAAAVREQLRREAAIVARDEAAAQEQQQRGGARGAGWLLTSGNTLTASILEEQQEQQQEQVVRGEVPWALHVESQVLPAMPPPAFMDAVDWSIINPLDGSINWGMVGMLALLVATLVMLTGFMHSWFALRAAMHSASGDVMVPVMFEHEGRLAQGFVLLPRDMARGMGDGAVVASMSPRKGAAVAPPHKAGCEIAAAKEEAMRVWGEQQLQQAEAQHQQATQPDATTVVIAAELVSAQPPARK